MRIILTVLGLSLTGCQPDLRPELDALRARVEAQENEIARLAGFVDAQANVLTVCQSTLTTLADYVVNLSTLGMLREAGAQLENLGACTDAFARFNEAAAEAAVP
jgi:hypothetical protein